MATARSIEEGKAKVAEDGSKIGSMADEEATKGLLALVEVDAAVVAAVVADVGAEVGSIVEEVGIVMKNKWNRCYSSSPFEIMGAFINGVKAIVAA